MSEAASAGYSGPRRLLSLDVLRGLTVAVMILVNNAGDGDVSYAQLRHSVWNGCTLTDVVFPLFLFMVGASIALSFTARLGRGAHKNEILLQLVRRCAVIFALGLLINALPFFDFAHLRIYGVLQRIALCFGAAGILFLYGRLRACVIAVPVLLVSYWFLLTHVHVPGMYPYNNLTAWIDRTVMPAAHLYHRGSYDPEGLLSTLPAIATTLIGVLAAAWLQGLRPVRDKTLDLVFAGLCCAGCGLAWAPSFPLNKRLWTSSFVLFTAGIALVLLAAMYYLVDGPPQWRRGLKPWLAFGTNALSAYIFSEVLAIALSAISISPQQNLQQWLFHLLPPWLGPGPFVSILYSVAFVAVCFVPMRALYTRRIFLKI